MIPKAGFFTRLIKSLLVGLAASVTRNGLPVLSIPSPIIDEWEKTERSLHDCSARQWKNGQIRITYSGPMVALDQGGMLNRTPTWKTVTDRDLRNRCIEGTGWSESET